MSKRGKQDQQQQDNLNAQAQTATDSIAPSAYEQYQQPQDLNTLQQLDSGADVSNIDGLRWTANLYNNRNKGFDDKGVGLLGNNQLSGNGNSQMLGAINEQEKARNDQEASGQLYNAVGQERQNALDRSQGFASQDDNRNFAKAGLANQRYSTFLNRPQRPSLFSQLLGGGMNAAAAYVGR